MLEVSSALGGICAMRFDDVEHIDKLSINGEFPYPEPQFLITRKKGVKLLNKIIETYDIVPIVDVQLDYDAIAMKFGAPINDNESEYSCWMYTNRAMMSREMQKAKEKVYRTLSPNVIVEESESWLANPILGQFAGIQIGASFNIVHKSDPFYMPDEHLFVLKPGCDFGYHNSLFNKLKNFDKQHSGKISFANICPRSSAALASINPDCKSRVLINDGFKITKEAAGLHIHNLLLFDGYELVNMLGSIGILVTDMPQYIPVGFKVSTLVIGGGHDPKIDCRNIAENPNIKTLFTKCELNADFGTNSTLLKYDGPNPEIMVIARQNHYNFVNQRFARTKAIVNHD